MYGGRAGAIKNVRFAAALVGAPETSRRQSGMATMGVSGTCRPASFGRRSLRDPADGRGMSADAELIRQSTLCRPSGPGLSRWLKPSGGSGLCAGSGFGKSRLDVKNAFMFLFPRRAARNADKTREYHMCYLALEGGDAF